MQLQELEISLTNQTNNMNTLRNWYKESEKDFVMHTLKLHYADSNLVEQMFKEELV